MRRGIALGGLGLLCIALSVVGVAAADGGHSDDDGGDELPEGAPYIDAGLDQEVVVGDEVLLDGGGTWDDQGDITQHEWTIETPDGRRIQPDCPSCWFTSFRVTQTGQYNVTLTVEDSGGHVNSDTLYVTVSSGSSGAPNSSVQPEATATGDSERGCWARDSEQYESTQTFAWCDAHPEVVEVEVGPDSIENVILEPSDVSRNYTGAARNDKGNIVIDVITFFEEADTILSEFNDSEDTNTVSGSNKEINSGEEQESADTPSEILCADYPGTGCPY